eukprot:scaffold71014_cov32-Tisochrysis_lutea.AAC.5
MICRHGGWGWRGASRLKTRNWKANIIEIFRAQHTKATAGQQSKPKCQMDTKLLGRETDPRPDGSKSWTHGSARTSLGRVAVLADIPTHKLTHGSTRSE